MRTIAIPISMLGLLLALAPSASAADEAVAALAGTRTHSSMAEPIEFAVLYKNDGGNAKTLPLEIRHSDGSTVTIQVPFDASAGKSQARMVTLHPNALKPGDYTVAVKTEGAAKPATFSVHRDEHPSAYMTAQWVQHQELPGTVAAKGGWMYFTSDFHSLHPRKPTADDMANAYVAARMKPYALCVLGGGHQLDLDLHNDWGDPWVQRSIAWRMQLDALSNRIYPIAGLHCFDEPGLTWWPTQPVGEFKADTNPYSIPHQLEEFTKRTGKKLPEGPFAFTGPQYAKHMDEWIDFIEQRQKYLEQAWNATRWATDSVNPKFVTINQVSSSYAPGDTTDGVDTRQDRAYDVLSGHGGYSDAGYGTMFPVRSAESFQGYSQGKPHYYLPTWGTHTWASMRNGVWMSWITKLEGIEYPPGEDYSLAGADGGYDGTNTVFEIAEINRRMALVGDVMRQIPKTPSPVAVLHSTRQDAWDIATLNSPKIHTPGAAPYANIHRAAVDSCFFRVMEQGIVPNWIDEVEASDKGADFLKQWKVIMCPRLTTATPAFQKALEGYIAAGGKLIQFKGDGLIIKGSIVADHGFGDPSEHWEEMQKNGGYSSPLYRDLQWRKWNNDFAPTFAKDFAAWIGEQPYCSSNRDVLLGVHKAGAATYLLFANNAQSQEDPRGVKAELIPAFTQVTIPDGGVVYDLFSGKEVHRLFKGKAPLWLAAGDGACWVHLPSAKMSFSLGDFGGGREERLHAIVSDDSSRYLPIRLRLRDQSGQLVDELFRATKPEAKGSSEFFLKYPMGSNAAPPNVTLEMAFLHHAPDYDLPSTVVSQKAGVATASADTSAVSVYFDDAKKITDLFAGKAMAPPYDKINWDAKRVWNLDPKKFAVFGPDDAAKKIADALKAKGMTVEVNPKYEIKPIVREPGRGGAGPIFGLDNFENINAHAIVLPGSPLLKNSFERGHINRPITATFPGPGRAYVQWGVSCYQPGWEDVFVQGDLDAGVAWLLDAINGKVDSKTVELEAKINPVEAKKTELPAKLVVGQEIKLNDTPVGVGSSPDGKTTYVLLYGGEASAYGADGKEIWRTQALLEGCNLAVSPKGDRIAVCGYPGLLVLDAKDGKILGGHRAKPYEKGEVPPANKMLAAAWNDKGTLVAAGWAVPNPKAPEPAVVLDADGKEVNKGVKIAGPVMGAAFVPGGNVLLLGGDQLAAVDALDGKQLWTNPVKGAQAFVFTADGKTGAAGGWGKNVSAFSLTDGKGTKQGTFDSVVGGVAFLPSGDLAVAVWGGVHPLYVLRGDGAKPAPLFQSQFGFQNVAWSEALKGLVAAEQGGKLWLLDADGKPKAMLSEVDGTTAYRLTLHGSDLLVGRMNRTVQRIKER
jgi:hypothetical protein